MKPETMILADGSEVVLVHLLFTPAFGDSRISCLPGLKDFSSGKYRQMPHLRTDDVRSVTCPVCKRTDDFKAGSEELRSKIGEYKVR